MRKRLRQQEAGESPDVHRVVGEERPRFLGRREWLAIAFLAVATAAVYANTLHNGFVGDDVGMIQRDPRIRDLRNIPRFLILPNVRPTEADAPVTLTFGYRPILQIAHSIDYSLYGLDPRGYHATNIALHILASALVFLVALRILGRFIPALFVALLFAVHPAHTEAVAHVTSRKDEFVAIFYLAGLYNFILYRAMPRRRYLVGIVSAYILALLSKESGITLPLTLLLYDAVVGLRGERTEQRTRLARWSRNLLDSVRRHWPLYLWLFLIAAAFGYYVTVHSGASGKREFWGGGLGPTLLTSARIHLHYIGLLLFPATLSADYSYNAFPVSSSVFDPAGLLALAAGAAILYGLIRLERISSIASFGGLWFFITLLPVSQLIPHHILLADRHLYLPSFGVFLMAGVLVGRLEVHARARRLLYPSVACLLLILSIRTVVRNRDWRDEFTLAVKTVQTSPGSAAAHSVLGHFLGRKGRLEEAEREFRTALRIKNDYGPAHTGLGALLAGRKKWADAEQELMMAVHLSPSFSQAHLELGRLYQLQGRWDKAEPSLKAAAQLDHYLDEAHLNLGLVYINQGRLTEAAKELETALEINPRSADAHLGLGRLALQTGRTDDALSHFQAAVKLQSGNAFARNNLGVLYVQRGQIDQAIEEFQAALRINPDFAEARSNLSRLYLRQGKVAEAERLRAREQK